ncbi:hypothetical protein DUNSADRAFT_5935 [Dunaliella salina]|nr:hypothetical protein DUNSADRAFT_5935 [Dunaliella salina]|eukprot:KAF5836430.1 hypothetical protein DUNSADRAFT_5935 [Dunaliella salina]
MPCSEGDQKQEYTMSELKQLGALCPDLESLELAGHKYAMEAKVQDCLCVIAERFTNLENLECHFKAPLQPGFAEAVLAFYTGCALRRPNRNPNPLVVNIFISGLEEEVAELRGLEKTWCTRNECLPGMQRKVELYMNCDGL